MAPPNHDHKEEASMASNNKPTTQRNLTQFADPYLTTADVGDLIGGRSGGRASPTGLNEMVRDGRLPRPDLGRGERRPERLRQAKGIQAPRQPQRPAAGNHN